MWTALPCYLSKPNTEFQYYPIFVRYILLVNHLEFILCATIIGALRLAVSFRSASLATIVSLLMLQGSLVQNT